MKKVFFASILSLFVALSAVFFWLRAAVPAYDFTVLMAGNVIMLLLSLATFFMVTNKIKNSSNAFISGVYSSTFLKLFICVIGIVMYAMINKPNVHKPSLFTLFGVYAVYSAVETWILSVLARNTK